MLVLYFHFIFILFLKLLKMLNMTNRFIVSLKVIMMEQWTEVFTIQYNYLLFLALCFFLFLVT